jgi:hypothetical protein
MSSQFFPRISVFEPAPAFLQPSKCCCPICERAVSLETANTDETGRAIHQECYLLKLKLKRASES